MKARKTQLRMVPVIRLEMSSEVNVAFSIISATTAQIHFAMKDLLIRRGRYFCPRETNRNRAIRDRRAKAMPAPSAPIRGTAIMEVTTSTTNGSGLTESMRLAMLSIFQHDSLPCSLELASTS